LVLIVQRSQYQLNVYLLLLAASLLFYHTLRLHHYCTAVQALSAAAGFAAAALQEALRKQRAEAAQRCDKLEQALVRTALLLTLLCM
jgi:hypothetical protein